MSRGLTTEEKILIKQINQLCELHKYEDAEEIFEKFVEQNPDNIEMLLRFGFFEYYALHDDLKAIEYLKKILKLDPNNLDALIILSDMIIARFDDELHLLNRLCSVEVKNPEYASMIEYCKSLFYKDKNDDEIYKKALKTSIELWPYHVYNYLDLSRFYKYKNNLKQAKDLIKKSLENVKLIYPEIHDIDYTDYQEYFNELIKGVHLPRWIYESYIEELNDLTSRTEKEDEN